MFDQKQQTFQEGNEKIDVLSKFKTDYTKIYFKTNYGLEKYNINDRIFIRHLGLPVALAFRNLAMEKKENIHKFDFPLYLYHQSCVISQAIPLAA